MRAPGTEGPATEDVAVMNEAALALSQLGRNEDALGFYTALARRAYFVKNPSL